MASRFRGLAGFALAGAVALAISACGAPPEEGGAGSAEGSAPATSAAGGGEASAVKACLVSDEGGFQDKSFNQSAKEGLDKAVADLGVEFATAESHSAAEYQPNIENLISQNCTIIFGVGFTINDAIRDAARANPDIKFALIDSSITENNEVVELENAKPLLFNTAEAAFAAGYLAAGMTESQKVGTWGGMQIPPVSIFMDGFVDGVAHYNEAKGTSVEVIGWDKEAQNGSFTGDFSDASKGKQLTAGMISQGADIIMPVAGNAGTGAFAAAKEAAGVSIVWVDSDGYETSQDGDIIMTSVMKEIGQAVYDTIESEVNGEYSAEPYVGNLENMGVGLAPYHDYDSKVSDELKAEVEQVIADIQSGTIKVESPNQP